MLPDTPLVRRLGEAALACAIYSKNGPEYYEVDYAERFRIFTELLEAFNRVREEADRAYSVEEVQNHLETMPLQVVRNPN